MGSGAGGADGGVGSGGGVVVVAEGSVCGGREGREKEKEGARRCTTRGVGGGLDV